MCFMGFVLKWIQWIKAYLVSSRSSTLVSGCPTKEFSPQLGLQQGDPLSPFLFISIIEGLNVALEEVVSHGLFRGAMVDDGGLVLSHLFYADNALFLGEWDEQNIETLVAALNYFYLVSSLKLNLHKSNLYGIDLPFQRVEEMAGIIGCDLACIPFSYLGLPVEANMNHVVNWNPIIQRLQKRLANRKMNLLSVGG
ncbi:uncharacterized protein LOC111877965 [Lactuca sativa]|uniref:uncharacterized protein LOC111877965 n=1 Tax=Lactuca sativa TaxID=4236 RepID=UPI000CD96931|nr:uncharacterized protein LOC111877965 [Lactuca sativa]